MKYLLIDGKNAIYRAYFAGKNNPVFQDGKKSKLFILFKFLNAQIYNFGINKIFIFWDDKLANLWRTSIFEQYKGNRDTDPEVTKEINEMIAHSIMIFKNLNSIQFFKKGQEADDLIYAFCKANNDKKLIVSSSDKDLVQLANAFENCRVYNPLKRDFKPINSHDYDIIKYKALVGDDSDNIPGYYKVGPKTAERILLEDSFDEFFKSDKAVINEFDENQNRIIVGDELYRKNLELIDLSRNPNTDENVDYIISKMDNEIKFDTDEINNILRKYSIYGLSDPNLFRYFKRFSQGS